MAVCAGALRRWLHHHNALPEGPLLAAVPVNIRGRDQNATEGNRLAKIIAPLPTHLDGPGERLRAVCESMAAAKISSAGFPGPVQRDSAIVDAGAGQSRLVGWLPECACSSAYHH